MNCLTFDVHSLALYRRISDILLMAMENGMTVWSESAELRSAPPSAPAVPVMWLPAVHSEQNTQSHVSQN